MKILIGDHVDIISGQYKGHHDIITNIKLRNNRLILDVGKITGLTMDQIKKRKYKSKKLDINSDQKTKLL